VQRILDAMTTAPAYVRNGRLDVLAADPLGQAVFAPVFVTVGRPVNIARFLFLDPARDFYVDCEELAGDTVALLRAEAGRDPYDRALTELIGQLSTRSETFRTRWAAHNVRQHRSGVKHLQHRQGMFGVVRGLPAAGPPQRVDRVVESAVGIPTVRVEQRQLPGEQFEPERGSGQHLRHTTGCRPSVTPDTARHRLAAVTAADPTRRRHGHPPGAPVLSRATSPSRARAPLALLRDGATRHPGL
jgi:hypothetical protein